LGKVRFDKLFSQGEANALLPRIELLVRQMQLQAGSLRERVMELARTDLELEEMVLPEIIERYPELKTITAKMAEVAGQIESFGCFLKDIDQGLVDFPGEVDGEVVFFCWQFGEPSVLAWHSIEGGFAERRPLPGTAKPYLN
jgi:hypothetical protein